MLTFLTVERVRRIDGRERENYRGLAMFGTGERRRGTQQKQVADSFIFPKYRLQKKDLMCSGVIMSLRVGK